MMYEKEITALGEIKYRKDISKETIDTFTRLVKRELPYTILTEKVRNVLWDMR